MVGPHKNGKSSNSSSRSRDGRKPHHQQQQQAQMALLNGEGNPLDSIQDIDPLALGMERDEAIGSRLEWRSHIIVCCFARRLHLRVFQDMASKLKLFSLNLERLTSPAFRNAFLQVRIAACLFSSIQRKRRALACITRSIEQLPYTLKLLTRMRAYKRRTNAAKRLLLTAVLCRRYHIARWIHRLNRLEWELLHPNGEPKKVERVLTATKEYRLETPMRRACTPDTVPGAPTVSVGEATWKPDSALEQRRKFLQGDLDLLRARRQVETATLEAQATGGGGILPTPAGLGSRVGPAPNSSKEPLVNGPGTKPKSSHRATKSSASTTMLTGTEPPSPVASTLAHWLKLYEEDEQREQAYNRRMLELGNKVETFPVGAFLESDTVDAYFQSSDGLATSRPASAMERHNPTTPVPFPNIVRPTSPGVGGSSSALSASQRRPLLFRFKYDVISKTLKEVRESHFQQWRDHQAAMSAYSKEVKKLNLWARNRRQRVQGAFLNKKSVLPAEFLRYPKPPLQWSHLIFLSHVFPNPQQAADLYSAVQDLQLSEFDRLSLTTSSGLLNRLGRDGPHILRQLTSMTEREETSVQQVQWMQWVRESSTLEYAFVVERCHLPLRVWESRLLKDRYRAVGPQREALVSVSNPAVLFSADQSDRNGATTGRGGEAWRPSTESLLSQCGIRLKADYYQSPELQRTVYADGLSTSGGPMALALHLASHIEDGVRARQDRRTHLRTSHRRLFKIAAVAPQSSEVSPSRSRSRSRLRKKKTQSSKSPPPRPQSAVPVKESSVFDSPAQVGMAASGTTPVGGHAWECYFSRNLDLIKFPAPPYAALLSAEAKKPRKKKPTVQKAPGRSSQSR